MNARDAVIIELAEAIQAYARSVGTIEADNLYRTVCKIAPHRVWGSQISSERRHLGYTAAYVGMLSAFGSSDICDIERGSLEYTLDDYRRVAKAVGLVLT